MTRAAKSDLAPPKKRAETVELAQALAKPRDPRALPPAAALKDPFSPPSLKEADPAGPGDSAKPGLPAAPPKVLPDRELLEAIADLIFPSGSVVIGGEPVLLFGGTTRRKVGETFFGTYAKDGKTYELKITAIGSGTFTLRYHNEETTRPISRRK